MADTIQKELGVEAQLIPGSSGVFDVVADGKLIFSKRQAGRFPEHKEVLQALGGAKPNP